MQERKKREQLYEEQSADARRIEASNYRSEEEEKMIKMSKAELRELVRSRKLEYVGGSKTELVQTIAEHLEKVKFKDLLYYHTGQFSSTSSRSSDGNQIVGSLCCQNYKSSTYVNTNPLLLKVKGWSCCRRDNFSDRGCFRKQATSLTYISKYYLSSCTALY